MSVANSQGSPLRGDFLAHRVKGAGNGVVKVSSRTSPGQYLQAFFSLPRRGKDGMGALGCAEVEPVFLSIGHMATISKEKVNANLGHNKSPSEIGGSVQHLCFDP